MTIEPSENASSPGAEQVRTRKVPITNCSASSPDVTLPPAIYLEAVCPSCDARLIRTIPNGERVEAICLDGHKWCTTNEKAWWDE